jgi:hypothetical protein
MRKGEGVRPKCCSILIVGGRMMTPGEEFVGSLLPPKRIPQQNPSAYSDALVPSAHAGGSMDISLSVPTPAEFTVVVPPQARGRALPSAFSGSSSC